MSFSDGAFCPRCKLRVDDLRRRDVADLLVATRHQINFGGDMSILRCGRVSHEEQQAARDAAWDERGRVAAAHVSALTPRDVARWDLCESIASALANAEAYMREVEAHHAALIAGPHTEAQRYASLSDVLLSHRVLGLLRPASEAMPFKPQTATTVIAPPSIPPAPFKCSACGSTDTDDVCPV